MKQASITYTKNHLSRLLGMVREGETILVMDRRTPVARIEPANPTMLDREDWKSALVASGTIVAPIQPLDVNRFLNAATGKMRKGASAVAALLQEREESP